MTGKPRKKKKKKQKSHLLMLESDQDHRSTQCTTNSKISERRNGSSSKRNESKNDLFECKLKIVTFFSQSSHHTSHSKNNANWQVQIHVRCVARMRQTIQRDEKQGGSTSRTQQPTTVVKRICTNTTSKSTNTTATFFTNLPHTDPARDRTECTFGCSNSACSWRQEDQLGDEPLQHSHTTA